MQKKSVVALITISLVVSFSAYADEAKEKPKVEGVQVVTDAAVALVQKSKALLFLDLEIDMSAKKPVPKNQYTFNALGQRVPRSTVLKRGEL